MYAPNDNQIHQLQKLICDQDHLESTFEEARLIGVRLFALHDLLNEISSDPQIQKSLGDQRGNQSH